MSFKVSIRISHYLQYLTALFIVEQNRYLRLMLFKAVNAAP